MLRISLPDQLLSSLALTESGAQTAQAADIVELQAELSHCKARIDAFHYDCTFAGTQNSTQSSRKVRRAVF
jgi:hypothetical protein